ncbi:MAG: carbohydrate kinase [Bacteroidota bacterium]
MLPTSFPVVCFGEALWDILPAITMPGGAPMNVAYHLKKLGINPALITKVGIDEYGEGIINLLAENEITTEFVCVDNGHATGRVYANAKDCHEVVYDIVSSSAWDYIEFKEEYSKLVSQGDFFVFGSLSSRNKTTRETLFQLLDLAKTKVLDLNLRPPHFKRCNVEYLLKKATILKLNLDELEFITGWFSTTKTIKQRMSLLQDRLNIQMLVVTLGADGAMLLIDGKFYRQPGFHVVVADTIGSGDSFLAAFISQLLQNATPASALEFASAVGAFVTSKKGGCPRYCPSDIPSIPAGVLPASSIKQPGNPL